MRLTFNLALAFSLAWKSLRHHRLVSFATVFGVAAGMCAVCSILIVDHNTARPLHKEKLSGTVEIHQRQSGSNTIALDRIRNTRIPITTVRIIKQQKTPEKTGAFPLSVSPQQLPGSLSAATRLTPTGEEDYQAMRLAIRMASLFAFFIGAVIVFYTMRFSLAMRTREFALLLCLGEQQRNIALSLLIEALLLGLCGTLIGMLVAGPIAALLLDMGISTTGRTPLSRFSIPYIEIAAMACISLFIALLGVISPIRSLYRQQIAGVLQARVLANGFNKTVFRYGGFSWLLPPLLLASYLAIRPFLESWLSVVYFFLLEAMFIILLVMVTIWWTRPVLRLIIYLIERLLKHLLPLETLLTVRRIRLTSHNFVFAISAVILVYSLLGGLSAITRTLKQEIYHWSSVAMTPYYFFNRTHDSAELDTTDIRQWENQHAIHIIRLSAKSKGSLPIRLVHAGDYNRYRAQMGKLLLRSTDVIFSATLAARFGVQPGDALLIDAPRQSYAFNVLEINDAIGAYAENAQYVDIKSYALFSSDSHLFKDNLGLTLGDLLIMRSANKPRTFLGNKMKTLLQPHYQFEKSGRNLTLWQLQEIDKDFLIFDYILGITVILAFIGIVNTLLIQVHAGRRELSVLKTLGLDRIQLLRLLLVEGFVIGLVGAVLAILLGTALGFVSVAFLDHFTLFQYQYVWSTRDTLAISFLAITTCCLSALYPAIVATDISSAESLHYE